MGPGPRFEPESRDPQSRRMTAYPTPAFKIYEIKNLLDAGAGIRTLVDLRQQVLSLSPLAARAPPHRKKRDNPLKNQHKINAPFGIRTRVSGSKGQNDWPDYTNGAWKKEHN